MKKEQYKCQQKFCTNIQLWFDGSLQLGYGSFLLGLTGRTGTGLKHQVNRRNASLQKRAGSPSLLVFF